MRLYMLPGVGHCGGGDGFAQFDTLGALMAWVETGVAPGALPAEKIPGRPMGPPPPRSMENGASRAPAPYARALEPSSASRMIAPFRGEDAAIPAHWLAADWLAPDFQKAFVAAPVGLRPAP